MTSEESSALSAGRGVSSVLGVSLLIAVVIAGMTTVVVIGGTALTDTKDQSEVKRAEHSMTLFDSRTAMVALGASEVQSVRLGQDSGSFKTRHDAGQLTLTHVNHSNTSDEVLFRQSLGAVVYQNGPTRIAYQSGGVWRLDRDGKARMISPPEFSYRDATLTLPIIRVTGNESASGSVSATVSRQQQAKRVFPDVTSSYNSSNQPYINPVTDGTVYAYVQSDYYQAWAEYFRTRTEGDVRVNDSSETVRLDLSSLGAPPGTFTVPEPGAGSVRAGGFGGGHPITEFSVSLEQETNFNNAYFIFWSDDGPNEFELNVHSNGKCTGGGYNDDVDIRVYYRNTTTGEHQEWKGTFGPGSDTIDVDCSLSDPVLNINFTSAEQMTYQDVSPTGTAGNKYHFPKMDNVSSFESNPTINQHSVDNGSYSTGAHNSLNWTVNHYLSRMPTNFELHVQADPGSSNRFYESGSTGELDYGQASGGRYVTYLHITENEVEVDFD